jgi:hypothetical protein
MRDGQHPGAGLKMADRQRIVHIPHVDHGGLGHAPAGLLKRLTLLRGRGRAKTIFLMQIQSGFESQEAADGVQAGNGKIL